MPAHQALASDPAAAAAQSVALAEEATVQVEDALAAGELEQDKAEAAEAAIADTAAVAVAEETEAASPEEPEEARDEA